MDLVVALDAGTTGVRALSLDSTTRVVDVAYRELTQHYPRPGEVEHDATEIATLAVETLSEVAALAGESVGLWRRDELADAWSSQVTFEPEDPFFADLGYEAWLRAAERA